MLHANLVMLHSCPCSVWTPGKLGDWLQTEGVHWPSPESLPSWSVVLLRSDLVPWSLSLDATDLPWVQQRLDWQTLFHPWLLVQLLFSGIICSPHQIRLEPSWNPAVVGVSLGGAVWKQIPVLDLGSFEGYNCFVWLFPSSSWTGLNDHSLGNETFLLPNLCLIPSWAAHLTLPTLGCLFF